MSQQPKESKDDQALICRDIKAICRDIETEKKSKDIGMLRHHCSHVVASRPRFHKLLISAHFQGPFPKCDAPKTRGSR